jgi:membrane associated rhomboid family serine protease
MERCTVCYGIWLQKGALERLQTIRDGENALAAIEQPRTQNNWLFQFFSGLPVEFNMRPRRAPVVTSLLVLACVLVFVFQFMAAMLGPPTAVEGPALGPFALVAADFPGGRWWLGLFSHQFLHGGLLHLIGNMYLLYVLGDNVEDMLGWWRYLLFYLGCGAVGGLAQTLADTGSTVPMVGASGAIAGLAAAYTLLFRRARITLMVWFWQWKISVLWYWGLWVAFNVVGAGLGIFGVGWFAHLGGFAFGLGITALAWERIQTANPVLQYLREGAPLARRLRQPLRRHFRHRQRARRPPAATG